MTIEDVRALLAQRCAELGSQSAWAARAGLSQPYVNDVLRGHRRPGKSILAALGLERVMSYAPVRTAAARRRAPGRRAP